MKYYDLTPVFKGHTNAVFRGGKPAPLEEAHVVGKAVGQLPLTDTGVSLRSVWKCRSLMARLQFLFRGEITLTVLGHSHPAVAVSVNDVSASAQRCEA